MTCLEAQERMAIFVAGVLPEASREGYRTHLSGCPACRASETRIREAWDLLEGLEIPPLPLDLADRLRAAAPLAPPQVPVPRPPPPPPVHLSAAPVLRRWRPITALMALTALGWGVHKHLQVKGKPPGVPADRPFLPPATTVFQDWRCPGPGTLRLTALPQADLWAAPGARGSLEEKEGRLVLEEGTAWGRLLSEDRLQVEAAGWTVTVTRGSFSATVTGEAASFTCHEGFLRVEAGPGFTSGPSAVPERTSVLLLPGRPPIGPRAARALYPGEPEDAEVELVRWRPKP